MSDNTFLVSEKKKVIELVPKENGDIWTISLSKMMDNSIKRLLYKAGSVLSPSVHGVIKGKIPSDCHKVF